MKTVSKKLLSLLLVAILLVSALPFQAFATEGGESSPTPAASEKHDANLPTHVLSGWQYNAETHWQLCSNANCEYAGQRLNENAHKFTNGVCEICGYVCSHGDMQGTVEVAGSAVAADCIHSGKEADIACAACGTVLKTGATIPATGVHDWDANGVCKVCGAKQEGAACQLVLDANGGTINGGSSMVLDVKQGYAIQSLPTPTRGGYTFDGWYIKDTDTRINIGTVYTFGERATAVAKWTEITYRLIVRRVLNNNFSTAYTIYNEEVPAGTPLLNYLNENVTAAVKSALAQTPGYTWEYSYWKDYSGNQPLTAQDTLMNQAQTVYVNFKANSYTLYFDAGNGTVTPNSKTVYFGSAVGTLPTPTLSGKVFRGWKDANGTVYDSTTVYKVASNNTLYAVWDDEALVMLYIYVNGNFNTCDRMILMDKYVKYDNISRSDVLTEIAKHYSAPYGYSLSIAGLFDESTWASYRANTSKAGTENIGITGDHLNKIYVMVNNAQSGTTILPTNPGSSTTTPGTTGPNGAYWVDTGNGNGYWVFPAPSGSATNPTYYPGTNPKTGDTAQLEVAAAVMILAAAALVTMMALRKKRA